MPGPQPLLIGVEANQRLEMIEGLGVREMVFKAALRGTDLRF